MKWRKQYLKYKLQYIKWTRKDQLANYIKKANEAVSYKNTIFRRLDFLLAHMMFGAESEDYFSFLFYLHENPFLRNHHVTRMRLNFLKGRVNRKEAVDFIDSKLDFNTFYSDYLGRKWCYPDDMTEEEFVSKMKSDKEIFIKIIDGFGGKGDFKAQADESSLRKVYRDITSGDSKYIVEEYFYQNGFLHDVNPSSLNTIRVTTARNKNGIKPLYSYFRAGGAGSAVDNLHSGGVSYPIDVDTGIIHEGHTYKEYGIVNHPSSNIKVAGYQIPNWKEIIDFAIRLHQMAPEGAGLIGWDFCVSNDGIIVIEGNAGPGFPVELNYKQNSWKKVRQFLDEY